MIFARRVGSRSSRDESSGDFEGVDVPRSAKVAAPFDDATEAARRRAIKARAALVLRRNGFSAREAGIALDVTGRAIQKWAAAIREYAESMED